MRTVRSFDAPEQAAAYTADILEQAVVTVLERKAEVVLGVPGGRSVEKVFGIFSGKDLPWKHIHIFFVDERLVPLEDEQSNYRVVDRFLLEPLRGRASRELPHIHPFDYTRGHTGSTYLDELESLGGAFDIILLGSGEDGHVAGVFPGHHTVTNNERTFLLYHDSPKPPRSRMTATVPLLSEAGTAVLLFIGNQKRDAFEKFGQAGERIETCPAKLVEHIEHTYSITAFT